METGIRAALWGSRDVNKVPNRAGKNMPQAEEQRSARNQSNSCTICGFPLSINIIHAVCKDRKSGPTSLFSAACL